MYINERHKVIEYVYFFKQKTAYEMRISDWRSDVCATDLPVEKGPGDRHHHDHDDGEEQPAIDHMVEARRRIDGGHFRDEDGGEGPHAVRQYGQGERADHEGDPQIGRASCRESGCQYV